MNLFRQVSTFLFCLVAAVFVQAYSHIQANILQFAHRLDMAHLPLLTLFYCVENRLALDFWSLLCMEWVDTKQFGF